jgi:hypothetical protein
MGYAKLEWSSEHGSCVAECANRTGLEALLEAIEIKTSSGSRRIILVSPFALSQESRIALTLLLESAWLVIGQTRCDEDIVLDVENPESGAAELKHKLDHQTNLPLFCAHEFR